MFFTVSPVQIPFQATSKYLFLFESLDLQARAHQSPTNKPKQFRTCLKIWQVVASMRESCWIASYANLGFHLRVLYDF